MIYSATAHNDSSYSWYSGTSMASAAITGIVANLLWNDPTLTFTQIVDILKYNGSKITGQACDDVYDCIMPKYQCHALPSDILTLSGDNYIDDSNHHQHRKVYDGPLVTEYAYCSYIVTLGIDKTKVDTNNYKNYSIDNVRYEPTDVCVSRRDGDGRESSYKISCVADVTNKVVLNTYTNGECDNNAGDSVISTKTIRSGMIDETTNHWYIVHCDSDTKNNGKYNYNTTAGINLNHCAAVARKYYVYDNECNFDKNLSPYEEIAYLSGACNIDTIYNYDSDSSGNSNRLYYFQNKCMIENTDDVSIEQIVYGSLNECISGNTNEMIRTSIIATEDGVCDGDSKINSVWQIIQCGTKMMNTNTSSTAGDDVNNNGHHGGGNGGGDRQKENVEYFEIFWVVLIVGFVCCLGIIWYGFLCIDKASKRRRRRKTMRRIDIKDDEESV